MLEAIVDEDDISEVESVEPIERPKEEAKFDDDDIAAMLMEDGGKSTPATNTATTEEIANEPQFHKAPAAPVISERPMPAKPNQTTPAVVNSETAQTKSCPYCSEQIKASAVKCKHCGEFLDRPRKKPGNWSPFLAATLNLFLPGVGYLYMGQIARGIIHMIAIPPVYAFFWFLTFVILTETGGSFFWGLIALFAFVFPIIAHALMVLHPFTIAAKERGE